jgi:signal transduction histidine kinase
MTDQHVEAITFEELAEPVIAYTVEDNEPRITTTNDSFERRFGSVTPEMPVETVFERFSVVNSTGDEDPITHLSRGDRGGIYLDEIGEEGPFFARVIPSGDDTGYLVFSQVSECLDVVEAPAINHVSSVISHDLRNPLDVAKAHLRAARETGDTEHFDAVANAHERMEQIIRDVLTITRDRTPVDPSDRVSIEAAAEDAWQSVDTDQATLDVTDTLSTVTADADRLQRLFENLFRNAVEHGSEINGDSTEHGQEAKSGRETAIIVGALEDGFYVADDGPGISPGEQNRVFDPGYSTRDGGTGLGLAIVERIVAAHGWELRLTAATNGGARFEIQF